MTMKHVAQYWERYLFATMGVGFMLASIIFLVQEKLAFFSTTFAVSFFCFFYSNLARFKRFKGLGFEAELWEDKQKEAADLIDQLKIMTVFTREIIMSRVMSGRWGSGANWRSHWDLFEELVGRHAELGQHIDVAPIKAELDRIFLFDIANYLQGKLLEPLRDAKSKAREKIAAEFGSPIKDPAAYGKRLEQLREVPDGINDLFARSAKENLCREIINNAMDAAERMKANFGIEIPYEQSVLANLKLAADAADHRPVVVTPELIALADRAGE